MDSPTIFLPSRKSWKRPWESSLSSDDSMALIRVVSYVHRVMPYDDDCSRFNGSGRIACAGGKLVFFLFRRCRFGHRGELVERVEERAYLAVAADGVHAPGLRQGAYEVEVIVRERAETFEITALDAGRVLLVQARIFVAHAFGEVPHPWASMSHSMGGHPNASSTYRGSTDRPRSVSMSFQKRSTDSLPPS